MTNLTDADIRSSKPGEYTDGDGLMLIVRPSGRAGAKPRRSWILRVMDRGKRRKIGLGAYPLVGLAEARRRAQDARRAIDEGKDPSVTAKRRERAAEAARSLTLGQAIDRYLATAPTYKNTRSTERRERALRVSFAPLHDKDVSKVSHADIAAILKSLPPFVAPMAHALIRSVFNHAGATLEPLGVQIANPTDRERLEHLGWQAQSGAHCEPNPALDWRRMPEFLTALNNDDSPAARCLALAILTTARSNSARLAKWADVNLETRVWAIPIEDLKDSRHRKEPLEIPLSQMAIELLEALPRNGPFLFPSLNDQALMCVMRRMHRRGNWKDPQSGKPAVAHGFRATFRTWVMARRLDRETAELAMGHVFHGEVERRYARDRVLDERRKLLELWGEHCNGRDNVVQLKLAR